MKRFVSSRAKSLFAAYFVLFLDNFGFALIFPIFPVIFLNPSFGILPSALPESTRNIYLGLVLAAFPFAQFFGAPLFGDYADRLGRKKILYMTLLGTAIGYWLTAVGLIFKMYSVILISRLITGLFSGNMAVCMATISDLNFAKTKRAKSLSYVSACLGLSWILAIIVGSFFTEPVKLEFLKPALPFWIIGCLSLISLLIIWKLFRETVAVDLNRRVQILRGIHHIIHVLEYKQMRTIFLVLFFWFFGFFIALQWAVPLAIEKYQAQTIEIMWLLLGQGIFWTLSSTFLNPRLIEQTSLWKITLWALFLISLFYFFGAVTNFFLYFAASYALSGIFAAISWGNSMSLISLSASSEDQGKSLGLGQSMLSLAQFLGPLFGGLIAGFDIDTIFYVSSILVFIGFLLLLVFVLRKKRRILQRSVI